MPPCMDCGGCYEVAPDVWIHPPISSLEWFLWRKRWDKAIAKRAKREAKLAEEKAAIKAALELEKKIHQLKQGKLDYEHSG